jgi:hypothetical protein
MLVNLIIMHNPVHTNTTLEYYTFFYYYYFLRHVSAVHSTIIGYKMYVRYITEKCTIGQESLPLYNQPDRYNTLNTISNKVN